VQRTTVAAPPWNRAGAEDLANIETWATGVLPDGELGMLPI
jgi:hypothetical protein